MSSGLSPLVSPLTSPVARSGALSPFSFARRGPSNSTPSSSVGTPSDRRAWTIKEDATILDAVQRDGTKNWAKIADEVNLITKGANGRTGKQCRERFHNHLDPNISKKPWSKEEEDIIIDIQSKVGNKWAEISKHLPGRTDNNVKNRWYSTLKRRRKRSSTDETVSDSVIHEDNSNKSPSMISVSMSTTPITTPLTSPKNNNTHTFTINSITPVQHMAELEQLKVIFTNFPQIKDYFGYNPSDLSYVIPHVLHSMFFQAKEMVDQEIKRKLISQPKVTTQMPVVPPATNKLNLSPLLIPQSKQTRIEDVPKLKIVIDNKSVNNNHVEDVSTSINSYRGEDTEESIVTKGLESYSKAYSPTGDFLFTPHFNELFANPSPRKGSEKLPALMTPRGLEEFARGLDDFLGAGDMLGGETPRHNADFASSMRDFDFLANIDPHFEPSSLVNNSGNKRKRSYDLFEDITLSQSLTGNSFSSPRFHDGYFQVETPRTLGTPGTPGGIGIPYHSTTGKINNSNFKMNTSALAQSIAHVLPSAPKKPKKEVVANADSNVIGKSQEEILQPIFSSFDSDGDGAISLNEFEKLIQTHSLDSTIKPQVFNDGNHCVLQLKQIFTSPDGSLSGKMSYTSFSRMYQTCLRCTESKKKKSKGTRNEAVLVRHIPVEFEGEKVRGCDHYAWTFCKGFEFTHNEKCKGSNRHECCPKYLANCTLWKHKLPPKVSIRGGDGGPLGSISDTDMSGFTSGTSSPFRGNTSPIPGGMHK